MRLSRTELAQKCARLGWGWGKQDKDDKGEKYGGYAEHREAMTAMALLAFWGIANCKILRVWGHRKAGIDYLHPIPRQIRKIGASGKLVEFTSSETKDPTHTPFVPTH